MASATLRLTRKRGGIAFSTQRWPITIDGDLVGSIGSRQTVELSVESGYHTLRVGSKRHLSPERSFQVAGGQLVKFTCRGRFSLGAYVVALVKPDLWISLHRDM